MKTQLDGSNLLESIMRDLPKKPVMACRHLVFVVPVKTAFAYCKFAGLGETPTRI